MGQQRLVTGISCVRFRQSEVAKKNTSLPSRSIATYNKNQWQDSVDYA